MNKYRGPAGIVSVYVTTERAEQFEFPDRIAEVPVGTVIVTDADGVNTAITGAEFAADYTKVKRKSPTPKPKATTEAEPATKKDEKGAGKAG